MANTEDWTRSDRYHNSFLLPDDEVLSKVITNQRSHGLPDIAVTPAQGKFLHLLAKTAGAKRILEVGTLGGYSTIWFARAVPTDGAVVTCEIDTKHIEVAKENFKLAGIESKVTILEGPASESLEKLPDEPKFDLVFIDADKESNAKYYLEAKRLTRSGAVIIIDNVVRRGRVSDPNCTDSSIEGVRLLLKTIKDDPEFEGTTIATVGEKGHDGFLYGIRR